MYVIMITFLQDMIVLTLNNLSEKSLLFMGEKSSSASSAFYFQNVFDQMD